MKKALVTLNIGNYMPELTNLTYRFMRFWAAKIGAEFIEITERKFPEVPILNFEKFQLYEIAQNYDWTFFLDADALIHPDTPDWAEMIGHDKSIVMFNGVDNRLNRFAPSIYSRRSGSRVGACTWNVICSDWTYELWTLPADFSAACQNITLQWCEEKTGHCLRDHLIDDYQLSENVAQFGLRVKTLNGMSEEMKHANYFYHHIYNVPPYEKLKSIRQRLDELGIQH